MAINTIEKQPTVAEAAKNTFQYFLSVSVINPNYTGKALQMWNKILKDESANTLFTMFNKHSVHVRKAGRFWRNESCPVNEKTFPTGAWTDFAACSVYTYAISLDHWNFSSWRARGATAGMAPREAQPARLQTPARILLPLGRALQGLRTTMAHASTHFIL